MKRASFVCPLLTLVLFAAATAASAQPPSAAPAPGAAATQAPAQQQRQAPIDRLRASIERIADNVNATWGIYVKSLETGEEIAIGADRQMDTMSVIKIPLMAETFRQIGAGKFRLADRVKVGVGD